MGGIVKVFTFVKSYVIIIVENKKTENYNATKNFETVFEISTYLLKGH